ncbi:MAG TPA: efflux transporter outer membrane subunit [Tepidisphaeraceae bacterium]|jgi:NodT family efflux transporter outer membrane factor (OMF) lipoprotein
MRAKELLFAAATAAALGGCAVGPNYKTPPTPVPDAFDVGPASPATTQPTTAASRPVDITRWWASLGDPELDSLVDRAVRANLDLKIALARLQQSRAQEYVVTGGTLPLVDFAAGAGRGTGSDSTRSRIPGPLHSAANTSGYKEITEVAGFDATWEIDFFGRFTRETEAARADTQAAYEARNAALITLVSDVARAYVEERAIAQRLAVAQHNLAIQQQSVDLVTARFNQGITNELDVTLAKRELATVQSTIAPLQAGIAQSQRRIAVLLGELPQDLYAELQRETPLPSPPEKFQPGLPIELLRRRPDIRQAERELAASTARIGVATADLFPRVALVASGGFQGQGLGRTPVMYKGIWSFGPSLYWPFLDFGTFDAILERQDFRTQELLYHYQRAVLTAVEEVDDAISNYQAQRDRLDRLNDAVAASAQAVDLATKRYERGLTDFLNVLDAQRQLFELQDQQAVAEESVVVQYIALYKALGGGWERYQQVPEIRHPQPALIAAGRETVKPTPAPQ